MEIEGDLWSYRDRNTVTNHRDEIVGRFQSFSFDLLLLLSRSASKSPEKTKSLEKTSDVPELLSRSASSSLDMLLLSDCFFSVSQSDLDCDFGF